MSEKFWKIQTIQLEEKVVNLNLDIVTSDWVKIRVCHSAVKRPTGPPKSWRLHI